jgi:hypothetical protein
LPSAAQLANFASLAIEPLCSPCCWRRRSSIGSPRMETEPSPRAVHGQNDWRRIPPPRAASSRAFKNAKWAAFSRSPLGPWFSVHARMTCPCGFNLTTDRQLGGVPVEVAGSILLSGCIIAVLVRAIAGPREVTCENLPATHPLFLEGKRRIPI